MLQPPSVSSPRLERKLSSNLIIHMRVLHLWTLPNLCLIMRGVHGAKFCIFPVRISVYLYVFSCFVVLWGFFFHKKKKNHWEENQTSSTVKRNIRKTKSQSQWSCWQNSPGGGVFNTHHCVCLSDLLINRKEEVRKWRGRLLNCPFPAETELLRELDMRILNQTGEDGNGGLDFNENRFFC